MGTQKYKTIMAALAGVPDPRKRRGQRYPWRLLLGLIATALLCGQPHGRAIGQWVQEHGDDLRERLGWTGRRMPSAATLRRALVAMDLTALDAGIRALVPEAERPDDGSVTALALDGKVVRGAAHHGQRVWLLGLADHWGQMRAQTALQDGQSELAAARDLLAKQDLSGQVITMDAAFTDAGLAQQIQTHGGDYLAVVKGNQPELLWAIETEFSSGRRLVAEQAQEYRVGETTDVGHGRIERRRLETSTRLTGYLAEWDWPGVGQVLRRTCRRVVLKTGEVSETTSYAVTSLTPGQVSVAQLEALWRGHWSIENQVHHVRDASFREDAGLAHTGHTVQALAALRNGILTRLRATGCTRIADALRHYAAHPDEALAFIGATS
jgi:predicted transposase YbfD/YdcC